MRKRLFTTATVVTALWACAATAAPSTAEQVLGEKLYLDENLSLLRNQACVTCHSLDPVESGEGHGLSTPGFVDPDNVRNGTPVSDGSVAGAFGVLNSPSAGYAALSPFFHWDGDEGLFVGGQFWNGRSPTLADQAAQPFLNPNEMAMPSKWAVVTRLKEDPEYVSRFTAVYGLDLDAIPDCSVGMTCDRQPPPGVLETYDRMARAIGEFEKSRVFNRFTSKFDYVLAGVATLTIEEEKGRKLFEGKALCSACHISEPSMAPDGTLLPPLFTDFTYDNLGLPRNVNIPGNPEPDPGLAGNPTVIATGVPEHEVGKHKVMSLRNIAVTPPYGHNGVFLTLHDIVHFYNTRDAKGAACIDNNDPGFGDTCWPAPEIPDNVNTDELGDLHLTPGQEAALVAFLIALTDGYPEWGNDSHVPPGTPSPFVMTPLPPAP